MDRAWMPKEQIVRALADKHSILDPGHLGISLLSLCSMDSFYPVLLSSRSSFGAERFRHLF